MNTENTQSAAPGAGPELQTAVTKPRPRLGLIILLVAAGVIVAGLAVASYLFLLKPGPDQIVRKYLAAQASGDYATLKTLLTKSSAEQLFPAGQPLPQPEKNPEIPDMEIGKPTINGNRASVPVTIKQGATTFGLPDQSLDMIVVQEGGSWKVDLQATIEELTKKLFGGQGMSGGQVAPPGRQP